MRGETFSALCATLASRNYFNPLPSCEGRRLQKRQTAQPYQISIHSPHARGDRPRKKSGLSREISIHSPHARGDYQPTAPPRPADYFNPLPSCEGRPFCRNLLDRFNHFNPLPSCEGRLFSSHRISINVYFNPLPSCEGRPVQPRHPMPCSDFNPLPSCEGRLKSFALTASVRVFQSTPLMRGETQADICAHAGLYYFNPLPSCEGRRDAKAALWPIR